eukprot:CAMPEP_0179421338 /NCGR_PEP_ID=MMETSP0799-20121207/9710_1 /TAXON_ID=46947 /ORGANISM="Geminigera cryophila, Strain CCMP2564" /LENGTH=107 /DNA_ID=CAMNT_0021195133 /DNA_START=567 /DNA_END=887 /DNA_ORIENTATION=-
MAKTALKYLCAACASGLHLPVEEAAGNARVEVLVGGAFPDNITAVSSRVRRILHVLNGVVAHIEPGVVHCALSDTRGVHASDARNRAAVKHGRVLEVAKTHDFRKMC